LSTLIANTSYDGTAAYSAATLESVALDPDGTATLDIEFVAGDIANPATPTISGTEADDITAIDTQITAATSYLVKAEAYDKSIDRQIRISDTIIQSKQSAISMMTEIDEVEEMNKKTDLLVRQQASIAMMAQANVSRSSIARLFE
jgi:flagellin-like hook-associated protein FlgL